MGALLLAAASPSAQSTDVWRTLPPTPVLPKASVGNYLSVGGARLWYATWGQRSSSPPVLLLHGGLANSNYYGNVIPALVKHGYYVVAIDSRGHGRSTRLDAPMTYHLMAEDVIAVLDVLKIPRASLVGWSDGGCIGYDLAINHPNRLARLFTFGSDADVSGVKENVEKDPVFEAYLARVSAEYKALSPTPDQWDRFRAAIDKMWYSLPAYTTEQLRSITVPTTIADGQYDEGIRPEHIKYLAMTIPNAKLVIIPNVSHFAVLQNPSTYSEAILHFLTAE